MNKITTQINTLFYTGWLPFSNTSSRTHGFGMIYAGSQLLCRKCMCYIEPVLRIRGLKFQPTNLSFLKEATDFRLPQATSSFGALIFEKCTFDFRMTLFKINKKVWISPYIKQKVAEVLENSTQQRFQTSIKNNDDVQTSLETWTNLVHVRLKTTSH